MKDKASESVNQFIKEKKTSNLRAIYNQVIDKVSNLPLLEDIMQATRKDPLDWTPSLPKALDQSNKSYVEQCIALDVGIQKSKTSSMELVLITTA